MNAEYLLRLVADCLTNNSMDRLFPKISSNCKYYSDNRIVANGKKEVCEFLSKRQKAIIRDNVSCFGYYAVVEKSKKQAVHVGANCVAVAQFDEFNCVGYMSIQNNIFGKIKSFHFYTDNDVSFKVDAPGKFNITKVPTDAHDAIGFRAFAFGIMDENVILSRHIQRYEIFQEYVHRVYAYIYRNLTSNFNQGITNAAGYMYITAMCVAYHRITGITLFEFDEKESVTGEVPNVDAKYKRMIADGFKKGKELFLGFTEYVNLRKPDESEFNEQLCQSYMDMCLYGSIQVNKEYDLKQID